LHRNKRDLIGSDGTYGLSSNGNPTIDSCCAAIEASFSAKANGQDFDLPVKYQQLQVEDMFLWIAEIRQHDPNLSNSAFNLRRSALKNLYIDFDQDWTDDMSNKIKQYYKRLSRTTARARDRGESSLHTGKAALQMGLYKWIN
jgi:hypothetical protein